MKRTVFLISLALFFGIAVAVFAGGQSEHSASSPSAKMTLNIMDNYAANDPKGPPKEEVFAEFMKKYPNIQIKDQVFKDSDIPTKVEVAYSAGKEPEIVFSNLFPTTAAWVAEGVAVPINNYIKDWGLEGKFVQAGLDLYTLKDGKIVAFPFEGFNWPIWYNMKVGKASGIDHIPTTIGELLADIPKIRSAGFEPYVTAGNDGESHQEFDMMVMAYLKPDEVGKVFHDGDWSLPDAVKGIDLFVKLRDAGLFSKDTPGLTNETKPVAYDKGNVFMQHGGSWDYSAAPPDIQQNVVLGGFPLPEGSVYAHPFYQLSFTGKGVFITRNGAKEINAVKDFVTLLYAPQNISKFVVQSSMISPIRDLKLTGSNLNPLFVQSMELKNVSVMVMPDQVIPPNVNLVSLTKQFYLTGNGSMTAPQMIDALTKLWQQAKK
jgi:multiple sugar transport system substrate-binding protein